MNIAQQAANFLYQCEEFVLPNIVKVQKQLGTQSIDLNFGTLKEDGVVIFVDGVEHGLKIAFSQIRSQT